ncbi:MAG: hypothetical protein BLM47_04390 [Candidatus Reconcilbacillus cellulovorans]|uniref:Uncharacterized protein n=1 Tax=Candidatus Reconcilbacillus cellulovorans TaxID=1906605 RepID=A0A2A6E1A3_9BACL|nr:MAG: hypothetical protein BLM47_04390 [Candidatus Reconcilbacillus cellulovorans]
MYDSLVLIGIDPTAEHILQRFIRQERRHPLVFRCEELRIWDPYGSLARSIVSALTRYPTIREIWILGCNDYICHHHSIPLKTKDSTADVVSYLISHQSGLPAERWLNVSTDPTAAVLETADLLRNHPLLPEGVSVMVAFIEVKDGG